jgi:hypothetical protein
MAFNLAAYGVLCLLSRLKRALKRQQKVSSKRPALADIEFAIGNKKPRSRRGFLYRLGLTFEVVD